MAKRLSRRSRTRAGTRSVATRKNETKTSTAGVKIDGRRLSRRIEFTPRMTEYIRQRYAEQGDSPEIISRSMGVAKATIQRLVKEQAWTRDARGPRDLSRADELAMQARALATQALNRGPEVSGAGESGGMTGTAAAQTEGEEAPVDIDRQIERLLRLVSDEIGVYENLRAVLKNEPQADRDATKTAHNLRSLTSTLDELRRMRAARQEPLYDDNDDFPADIDAFRNELARRIRAFVADRRGSDGGAEDAAK
jgi:hypothetical protein